MLYTKLAVLATLSALASANPDATRVQVRAKGNNGGNAGGNAGGLTLQSNAVQTGSANNGQNEIGAEAGQALSDTSTNNFINFCAGKVLTNGLQHVEGSCNGIVMGDIPAKTNMVSSVILFPTTGGNPIASDTTFNITVQVANLVAGAFTNADSTYYAAPQSLSGGNIVGHTHVTVQNIGNNLNPQTPLDATQFSFFKGINDAGNGKGTLQAVVTGGLPAGNYRVCTLSSASNHQPVLLPVAQRGSPDDCTKFTVNGNGNTINIAANNGSKGIAAAAAVSEAVVGATNSAFAASVIAAESSAAAAAAAAAAGATQSAAAGKGTGKGGNTAAAAQNTAAAAGKGKGKGRGKGRGKGKGGNTATAAPNTAAAAGKGGKTTAAAPAAQNTAAATAKAGKKGTAGKGAGKGRGRKQRFAKREFVA